MGDRQQTLRALLGASQRLFLPSGGVNDQTHLLGHVIVTVLLTIAVLVASWLCLFNGAY